MSIPPGLIGAVGATLDWSKTAALRPPDQAVMILPYMLRHLTPPLVAALGLGAIAAAVMSSIDSSFLSASSLFVWNVYRPLFRPHAGHGEIRLMVRITILTVGTLAAVFALATQSIYSLWVLCSDLVYVILFPQLVCALFVRWTNTAGCLAGAGVGLARANPGGRTVDRHSIARRAAHDRFDRDHGIPLSHGGHARGVADNPGRVAVDVDGFSAPPVRSTIKRSGIDARGSHDRHMSDQVHPSLIVYSPRTEISGLRGPRIYGDRPSVRSSDCGGHLSAELSPGVSAG